MRITGLLLLLALASVRPAAHGGAPFDASGFSSLANIQIHVYTGTEGLSNFPVLVKFSANLAGFSYSQFLSPGAGDLRFVSGGTNELNYELDVWNPTGASYVWVQVPALSSAGTLITAYWGQAGAAKPAYTTNGATWSNGYYGSIDEVRLSGVVRSDDWLQACYQNQRTPQAFMTFEFVPKLTGQLDTEANLVLSWPGTSLLPQVSSAIGPGAFWSTNGFPAPVVSNGINYVTVPCHAAAAYYRLAIPVKEFALSASATNMNVAQGLVEASTITVLPLNGFSNSVSLSVSNLPGGVAAYFNPAVTANTSTLMLAIR